MDAVKQKTIDFSKEITVFAKDNEFKCKCGNDIGQKKVFRIFRRLGVMVKGNFPAQQYVRCFERTFKRCANGIDVRVYRVRQEYEKMLADKVRAFADKYCVCESVKQVKPVKLTKEEQEKFERDRALQAARKMVLMRMTYADQLQALIDEFGFTDEELLIDENLL